MTCQVCGATDTRVKRTLPASDLKIRVHLCPAGHVFETVETYRTRAELLPVARPHATGTPPPRVPHASPTLFGGVGGGLPSGSESPDPPGISSKESIPRARSKPRSAFSPAFIAFWALYPRHVGKAAAWKAWIKIDPTSELIQRITAAITWQRVEFGKRDPEKVPHASTWLNGARWEDERPASQTNGHALSAPVKPPWVLAEQAREKARQAEAAATAAAYEKLARGGA